MAWLQQHSASMHCWWYDSISVRSSSEPLLHTLLHTSLDLFSGGGVKVAPLP